MKPYIFNLPTRLIFGAQCIEQLGDQLSGKFSSLLLVTGRSSADKSGALSEVRELTKGLDVAVFNEVEENPGFSTLERGTRMARDLHIDLVVGIGGGSPMDAAKGIAVLAKNNAGIGEYMAGKPLARNPLPVVCIPTTSGSGSEATPYAVFTDAENQDKGGFSHPGIFPIFSLIDPQLTYTMPEEVILNTGIDALTHALEAFLSTRSFPLNDTISLHAMEQVVRYLPVAVEKKSPSAMNHMSHASLTAGIAIAHAGTIVLHALGYPLTVFHGVPHGRANASMLPVFLKFIKTKSTASGKADRLNRLWRRYDGVDGFLHALGISTRLSDYGVQEDDIEAFVSRTILKKNLTITPARVGEDTLRDLYRDAL